MERSHPTASTPCLADPGIEIRSTAVEHADSFEDALVERGAPALDYVTVIALELRVEVFALVLVLLRQDFRDEDGNIPDEPIFRSTPHAHEAGALLGEGAPAAWTNNLDNGHPRHGRPARVGRVALRNNHPGP